MKKILSLLLLIAPIIAHATGPTPLDDPDDAVLADDGPYELAETLPGDSTTAVSASYVKGAYNDAISAINNIYYNHMYRNNQTGQEITGPVLGRDDVIYGLGTGDDFSAADHIFMSAKAVIGAIDYKLNEQASDIDDTISDLRNDLDDSVDNMILHLDNKRVSAVTTWGNDTPTKIPLVNQ